MLSRLAALPESSPCNLIAETSLRFLLGGFAFGVNHQLDVYHPAWALTNFCTLIVEPEKHLFPGWSPSQLYSVCSCTIFCLQYPAYNFIHPYIYQALSKYSLLYLSFLLLSQEFLEYQLSVPLLPPPLKFMCRLGWTNFFRLAVHPSSTSDVLTHGCLQYPAYILKSYGYFFSLSFPPITAILSSNHFHPDKTASSPHLLQLV